MAMVLPLLLASPALGQVPGLRVHGAIAAGEHVLDQPAFAALGARELRTKTPWTQGVQTFTGLPLAELLRQLGSTGRLLESHALNDYMVESSISDLVARDAFVAFAQGGKPLSVREKGPFWLIFPWSDRPELNAPDTHELSIWQLTRMEIR